MSPVKRTGARPPSSTATRTSGSRGPTTQYNLPTVSHWYGAPTLDAAPGRSPRNCFATAALSADSSGLACPAGSRAAGASLVAVADRARPLWRRGSGRRTGGQYIRQQHDWTNGRPHVCPKIGAFSGERERERSRLQRRVSRLWGYSRGRSFTRVRAHPLHASRMPWKPDECADGAGEVRARAGVRRVDDERALRAPRCVATDGIQVGAPVQGRRRRRAERAQSCSAWLSASNGDQD